MLNVNKLSKDFRLSRKARKAANSSTFQAVSELSFSAEAGEVIGVLGANGAGKTTTLRMLSGILTPSSGEIECELANPVNEPLRYRQQLGFLSGAKGLYDRLTVRENLNYFARLYGVSKPLLQQRIEELSALLELDDFIERKVSELSTGMRQRAAIARALIHDPKLIILDEPTTGLDIVATDRVLQSIESLKSQGKTILFATHHMHEVELLCDRLLVIERGRKRFFGTMEEFLRLNQASNLNQALRTCLQLGGAA